MSCFNYKQRESYQSSSPELPNRIQQPRFWFNLLVALWETPTYVGANLNIVFLFILKKEPGKSTIFQHICAMGSNAQTLNSIILPFNVKRMSMYYFWSKTQFSLPWLGFKTQQPWMGYKWMNVIGLWLLSLKGTVSLLVFTAVFMVQMSPCCVMEINSVADYFHSLRYSSTRKEAMLHFIAVVVNG